MIQNKIDELITGCLNLIDYKGQVGIFTPIYVEFVTQLESFIKDNNLEASDEWGEIKKYTLKTRTSILLNGEVTEIIKQLRLLEKRLASADSEAFWSKIHIEIKTLCYKKFQDKHYADAVETAFKQLEVKIKEIYRKSQGKEYTSSAASLMTMVFSVTNPIIELDDLTTQSGRDKQNGFMRIYEGVMIGIRNPKAHGILNITDTNAIHKLTTASMLFYELEQAKKIN